MHSIEHSGHMFTALGIQNGNYIWPIKEYLVRTRHGKNVRERIERLNPNGKPEGEGPRGWHRKCKLYHFLLDLVPVREFIAKHGRGAYRALPKSAFVRKGLEKGITRLAMVQYGR